MTLMEWEIFKGGIAWGIIIGWLTYWVCQRIMKATDLWLLRNDLELQKMHADLLDRMAAELDPVEKSQ